MILSGTIISLQTPVYQTFRLFQCCKKSNKGIPDMSTKTTIKFVLDDIYNKDGFLIKMFGTKSKSWKYENEIRLIYSTSKRKGYNPFALKSIYFGLNMDEMHQIQIIEGLTNRDIRFYKM